MASAWGIVKAVLAFLIISAIIAFFYPVIKPKLDQAIASINDPVQKGFVRTFDVFCRLCYELWAWIFKQAGIVQEIRIVEHGKAHCTCICS